MKKVFLLEPMRDKNLSHFCKFHLFLVKKSFWNKLPGRSLTLILLWQRYYDLTSMPILLSLCICWDEIFEPLFDYGYSLTDISFEYENQYLCIKNTITYLCNGFCLISWCLFSALFRPISFQQLAMALAICSYMEEALHQVRYLKAFWQFCLKKPFSECDGK